MSTFTMGSFFGFKVQIVDSVTTESISKVGYAMTPSMTSGDFEEFVNLLKGGFAAVYTGYATPMPNDPWLISSSFRVFGGAIAILQTQVAGKKIKRTSKLASGTWQSSDTGKDFDIAFICQLGAFVLDVNSKSKVLAGMGFLRRTLRYFACLWLSEHGRALLRSAITRCTKLAEKHTVLVFPAAAPIPDPMALPGAAPESLFKTKSNLLQAERMNEFGGFRDSAEFGQVAVGKVGAIYIDVVRVDGAVMYPGANGLALKYSSIPIAATCDGKPPAPNGPGCYIEKIEYKEVGRTFEFIRFGHELVHVLAATTWQTAKARFPATYASIVNGTQMFENACLANDLLTTFEGKLFRTFLRDRVVWQGGVPIVELDKVKLGNDAPSLTKAVRTAIVEMATITGKVAAADISGISGKVCGVEQALSENALNRAYGRTERGAHLGLGVGWLMVGKSIKNIIGDDDIDQGLTGAGSLDLEMNLSASVKKLLEPDEAIKPSLLDFGVLSQK